MAHSGLRGGLVLSISSLSRSWLGDKAPDDAIDAKHDSDVSTSSTSDVKFTGDVVSFAKDVVKNREIAQEADKVDTNPTEGQKQAGNYQKGHINVQGFDITIENPKGSVRSGVDADGKA
jgi:hypothetical protein